MKRAGHHRSAAAVRVLLFVALLAGVPAAHAAKDVLVLTPGTSTVALGKLVRDNSASTTFSVSNQGVVTTTGNGVRVGTGSVSTLSFTLTCTNNGGACTVGSGNQYTFTISGSSTATGITVPNFKSPSLTGATLVGTPSAGNPFTFNFTVTSWSNVTVTLPFDFQVAANATRALDSFTYTAQVDQTQ